jgi:hypothetical protein
LSCKQTKKIKPEFDQANPTTNFQKIKELKNILMSWGQVAHACHPSYLGG